MCAVIMKKSNPTGTWKHRKISLYWHKLIWNYLKTISTWYWWYPRTIIDPNKTILLSFWLIYKLFLSINYCYKGLIVIAHRFHKRRETRDLSGPFLQSIQASSVFRKYIASLRLCQPANLISLWFNLSTWTCDLNFSFKIKKTFWDRKTE